ncbi:hypothetical protein NESM_000303000 [Novymonas esmeraldas]|uniref:EF-hand domain-containing protein n=1 Tax=Novymonas esmeraldas TaxID=1808958 RepID=A0AAW0FB98_9TRYP
MSVEDGYRASIARARREDQESRSRRRRLRHEYQDELNRIRIAHARASFLSDAQLHIARRSTAEESVMFTLRNTAACWSEVCERAVTRQLDIEVARKNKQLRDATFLERTQARELEAQRSVEESDQARWETLRARYAAQLLTDRDAAVRAALEEMVGLTAQCASDLEASHLDRAGTPLLAAFAVDARLWRRAGPGGDGGGAGGGSAAAVVREAFQHIFHGSPYALSSPALLSLLQFCYGQHRTAPPLAQVLRLCSVPIFVLDGPKYSGKSLLATFLKSKHRLLRISDETLVQRALRAAAAALTRTARSGDGDGDGDGGSGAGAVEEGESGAEAGWAVLGHSLQATLLDGGAVDVHLMTDLLCLQLEELRSAREALPYDAILLEGVLRSAAAYKAVAQRLSSHPTHPHRGIAQRWGLTAGAAATGDGCAAGAGAAAVADALPPLLRLPDHLSSEHDTPAKQELKTRPMKKVDLAALPPAELPGVEDTHAAQESERVFIAKAEEELASLPVVLSGVLHISCAPEEVFRRFAGLRIDSETGEKYHLTYNPPPPERLPFMVSPGRPDVSSVELHEAVFHHVEGWAATRRWLTQQSDGPAFARVYELAGDGPAEQVQREALQAVDQILSNFRISRRLLDEHDASAARLQELEARWQAQKAAREAERLRLLELYAEKGAPVPPLLQTTAERPSGSSVTTLSAGAADVMLKALTNFTDNYEGDYAGVWRSITQLVQLLLRYYTNTEAQMTLYWKRPDDKQSILHRFQRCFDALPASMRVLPTCKAELHLSLDALDEALHRCIAVRDGEARGMLDTLTGAASFMGGWQTLVCQELMRLLQAEVDRYTFALHMFSFFLGAATGEPLAFDDVEADMPLLVGGGGGGGGDRPVQASSVTADASPSSTPAGKPAKEKRAAATKKGHKAAEEQSERTAEEQLAEMVQAVLGGFSSITEKLKTVVDAQGKVPKRAGGGAGGGNSNAASSLTAPTSVFAVATGKCYGLMEAERAAASARVAAVHACGRLLLKEAEAHARKMRARMEASLLDVMAREAAAANTAVYVMRACVEAEKKSPAMHLGCTTFAVLPDRPQRLSRSGGSTGGAFGGTSNTPTKAGSGGEERHSFLTDVPLFAHLTHPKLTLHPGLTAVRLLELVQQFRCVAPDFQLSRFDFLLLLEDDDYAEAAAVGLDAAHMAVKSREELFSTFDPQRSGFVDWRDVVVHLLFWVAPAAAATPTVAANAPATTTAAASPHGFREISLQDLLNTRASLGLVGLTEEQFFDMPLFFDRHLDDALLEAYTRILWSTFHDVATQTIQPYVLLGFLCADPQPIRGAQKAFHVLSSPRADGRVSFDEMDALCHLKANNARLMGQPDPCSKMHLRLLFGAATTCSFESVCASPMGRKMLNQADIFRRRQFFKRK